MLQCLYVVYSASYEKRIQLEKNQYRSQFLFYFLIYCYVTSTPCQVSQYRIVKPLACICAEILILCHVQSKATELQIECCDTTLWSL